MTQDCETDSDPAAFSIIGSRLYLNSGDEARALWRQNLPTSIAAAD